MSPTDMTANEQPLPQRHIWAVSSLALSMLLSSLGVSVANVALPTLVEAFNAPFQTVQWVVLAYLLAITTLIVSAGRLGDVMDHRRVLLIGITIFTGASLLCGLAPNLELLIAARALQGLGAAVLMALTVALVRETVAKDRMGSAMGLLGSMSAIGTALGPSLGGLLIAGPGWRMIFLVMVPLGLINLLLAGRFLPNSDGNAKAGTARFDIWGTLLLGLTLAAYALALTWGEGRFDKLNLFLLGGAALGVGLFLWSQTQVRAPLIRLDMVRQARLGANLSMNGLVACVMLTTLVVGPFFLARALGLAEAVVGLIMSIGPAISTLSGVPSGRLVDRWGAGRVLLLGLGLMLLGCLGLAFLPPLYGLAGYIAAIALLTPGYQLFQAANNTDVMMEVEQDQRGAVSGLLSLARNLGFITGAAVMGALFAQATGSSDFTGASAADVTHGLQVTFAAAAVLVLLALALAAWRRLKIR